MLGVTHRPLAAQRRKMPVLDPAAGQLRIQRIAREVRMTLRMRNAADVRQQRHLMQPKQIEKPLERMIRVTDGK